jgi:hypothetical protein
MTLEEAFIAFAPTIAATGAKILMWVQDRTDAKQKEDQIEIEGQLDFLEVEVKRTVTRPLIDWGNVGSLYWLGNDLMWVKDHMYRGFHPKEVLKGIKNAIGYCEQLGLGPKSFPHQKLSYTAALLEKYDTVVEWDEDNFKEVVDRYDEIAGYIDQVKFFMDAKVKAQQVGFQKL